MSEAHFPCLLIALYTTSSLYGAESGTRTHKSGLEDRQFAIALIPAYNTVDGIRTRVSDRQSCALGQTVLTSRVVGYEGIEPPSTLYERGILYR